MEGLIMTATTFTVGNFKGGVGKTKITTMLAYDAAVLRNKKTLVIDLDPQANATTILARTGNIANIDYTITDCILDRHSNEGELNFKTNPLESDFPLNKIIYNINDNLDLIGCDTSFKNFSDFIRIYSHDQRRQVSFISDLIKPLKNDYEYIFIDVPPTISAFSDNAMAASDYSIIAFQTQDESLIGVNKYISYQNFMVERYNISLQVIAIVACMLEPDDDLDKTIYNEAKNLYGDVVTKTVVTYQKRIKKYSRQGIHLNKYKNGNYDQWDFKAHNCFNEILNEIEAREKFLRSEL